MKQKLFALLLISLFCFKVHGQARFDRRYFINPGLAFFATQNTNQTYDLWYGSRFVRINNFGDTLLSYLFASGNGLGFYIPYVTESKSNGYILTASPPDTGVCVSSNTISAVIAAVDTQYSVLWSKNYKFLSTCLTYGVRVCQDRNLNILLVGNSLTPVSSYFRYPYFIKTDYLGNLLFSKKYSSPKQGGCQYAQQMLDGNYLVGLNLDSIGSVLMKTDTAGNTLWTKHYSIPHSMQEGILEGTDSTFLMYGYTDSSGQASPNAYALFIVRLSKDGNVIWSKRYGDSTSTTGYFTSAIIKSSDGNYVVVTQLQINGQTNTLLMKIDVNGNIIWTVSHGDASHNEYAEGITETSDKGFIFGGETQGNYPGSPTSLNAQVIKTDSTGHAGCNEFDINNLTVANFPMLAVDMAPFPSIDSAIVTQGTVHDSTFGFGAFNNYTICLNTEVKENSNKEITTIIYPNPNTGSFSIKEPTLKAPFPYLCVYDSMGRIILQKPIAKEEDKQIDLTKQGKGIYLIKITEGVEVITKKVVIE